MGGKKRAKGEMASGCFPGMYGWLFILVSVYFAAKEKQIISIYPKNNSERSLRRTHRARVLGAGFDRETAAEDGG